MALPKSFQLPAFAPTFVPNSRPAAAKPTQMSAAGGISPELEALLQPFDRPRGNWADAAGILGGALMDLDGTMGAGNMAAANTRWKDFVADQESRDARTKQQGIMKRAAMGDPTALALMDPLGNREYLTGRADRKEDIGREDAAIQRDEGWRMKDFLHTLSRDRTGDDQWEKEFDENVRQFGQTMDFKQDELGVEGWKAALEAGENTPTQEGQLRKEFLAQNADFLDVQRAIQKIRGLDTSTAAGQMGLVFNIMKMYDPGSTVREGEYATAKNTTGVPGRVLNAYNGMVDGTFLEGDQIDEFMSTADGLYDSALQDFDRTFQTYRGSVAPGYGFDLDRTVPDLRDPNLILGSFKMPSGANIPADAVRELGRNPTYQEVQEFNSTFGDGMGESILQALGLEVPEPVRPRTYDPRR